jgi:hypothetical protein
MRNATFLSAIALAIPIAPAGAAATAQEEEINTGQDFSKPLTRVDLRYQYQNLPPDTNDNSHIFTMRADKPFTLGGGWQLSTRVDIPLVLTDAPDGGNTFGLGDMLMQGLFIKPLDARWAIGLGAQLIFPTATADETGSGHWRIVPTVAARAALPELGKGVWLAGLLRYDTDFAGDSDRPGRSDLILQPILNVPITTTWFINFAPEIKHNFDDRRPGDSGRWFVPFNLLIGHVWPGKAVASLDLNAPIVDDYRQYDFKAELRLGFFF